MGQPESARSAILHNFFSVAVAAQKSCNAEFLEKKKRGLQGEV
jgi:hypothetical protein